MAEELKLDRAWSEAWLQLAAKFGIHDQSTIDFVRRAAMLALTRAFKDHPAKVSFNSPLGMLLRRRFVKGLAICSKQDIDKSRLELAPEDQHFAETEVHRQMVTNIGSASGSWFDPWITKFAVPNQLVGDVPSSYLRCVLDSVRAMMEDQEKEFLQVDDDEMEIAERVRCQQLGKPYAKRRGPLAIQPAPRRRTRESHETA